MTVLYKNTDRCTDLILDFIAGGESGGNYNAVIGNAYATEDLAQFKINDIYWKQRILAQEQPSSAIGRYQFVRGTLQSLCEQARIPMTTLFTPELQDRLAWMLLCRRGYQAWWLASVGTLVSADRTFAHALSMEWASLPDPMNGGKSHYDGVGPNHAACLLNAVYAMLIKARGQFK